MSTTLPGVAACPGQVNTPKGYLTSYAYNALNQLTDVTQGAQLRHFAYDGLSRKISETNPETGNTTYTFDSDTTNCGSGNSFPGDLASIRVSNTNVTCLSYDLLHRLLARTSTDGSSKNSNFTWDSATVDGQAVGQGGKLAEAWTCPYTSKLCVGNHQTDEGFQYDTRGNIVGYFQQSPNSAGWYTVQDQIDAIGNLSSLSAKAANGSLFVPTFSIGAYDGEGRPANIQASYGINPLASSIEYGFFGVNSVTYGSGDSDVFGHDHLGHITSYVPALLSSD
jgi:YD repeat-containing protein